MKEAAAKLQGSERFRRIREELLSAPVYLCPERALLVTAFHKRHDDPSDHVMLRKAKALRHILLNKSAYIYPHELIVGNVGSRRISAIMQPELAGVFMSEDLLWIDRRRATPLRISWRDRLRLLVEVIPYWLTHNMNSRAFRDRRHLLRYVREQLNPVYYLINEAGGIGHFLPGYERMIRLGVRGFLEEMEGRQGPLYEAARIACEGLVGFARRLSAEAESLARGEVDPLRRDELREIARICRKVPAEPADTFHEALQSLWLTHLAVNLESLNSAVSFGRVDQYLYPYYRRDLEEGRLTREQAKDMLLSFSAKAAEHVFLLSERISQYHGGYLVVQAAVVGGMDREGNDAVNDLTYLFLEVMEEAGLRDPNYQARVHAGSPDEYLRRVAEVARGGNGMPAVFGDEAAVASLVYHGYEVEEARDYAVVGCVELALPGKSFLSTDAALFNLPLCLELALNQGRRFGARRRVGAATPPPGEFRDLEEVIDAFRAQVESMVDRMVGDLQVVETGNRDYHPTPFSSMLVEGCLETGKDLTEGGARYNSSGVQGVGVADVADSLAALEQVVFGSGRYSMAEVVEALKSDFAGQERLRAELLTAPKFGNDDPRADRYADLVVRIFHDALARHRNTRGGPYVPGFYSVTCHVAFGRGTGALPSGRRAGEPLASSLSPANGRDRLGPTALLNSVTAVDSRLMPNGCAVNLSFDPVSLGGERGVENLAALLRGYFARGGMQVQFNVIDPQLLLDARRNPGKYPGLVVRVAGYCAYFDDLPDAAKEEIISRTLQRA
ncbi:MAG: formate C-acetyltransferase/glycerol dehydratase family glycyl radical enzyme [Actinobacteria bacterium]|nr:formate C-acetyltransferase/glycerol dehydratase family glycyl radical enzyme [Actinomycetota bacterium]MDI6832023.1 formate C-acetyltransferase/glycerol dehydratase family glycyl radical enzyme [Actinomycetota bacterium]